MTEERKQEIIDDLMEVYQNWEPAPEQEPRMPLYDLVSGYNKEYDNKELIGGDWVLENCPSPLKDLPVWRTDEFPF